MWITEVMICLAKGHDFRKITHNGSTYAYCQRCGRVVWEHSHISHRRYKSNRSALSAATATR
jgi:hypothetical protein